MAKDAERSPRVFVAYSWDDAAHEEWVKQLVARLRQDGVDVTLDSWDAMHGDSIQEFMNRAPNESDFVIAICTPQFLIKSDIGDPGVGYEAGLLKKFANTIEGESKIIPVLRSGNWSESTPAWLRGKFGIDLRGQPYSDPEYEKLRQSLSRERGQAQSSRLEAETDFPSSAYYHFLEPRFGTRYRQWFVKGRGIRADVLYGQTLGPDARTPEELARDYNLPTEAVLEAVEYCLHNEDVLRQDFEMEEDAERRRMNRVARLGSENGRES